MEKNSADPFHILLTSRNLNCLYSQQERQMDREMDTENECESAPGAGQPGASTLGGLRQATNQLSSEWRPSDHHAELSAILVFPHLSVF